MKKQIFKVTVIAGALDIIAACVQSYISKGVTPDMVLKYVASGLFGKDAYSGGAAYLLIGLIIHFFIAFACTVTYFFVYPKIKVLHRSILLSSLFIAVIAWFIPSRIIVPISKIQAQPFNLIKATIATAILYFSIGLPIAFFTKYFYKSRKES